jgi:hypothetical protein
MKVKWKNKTIPTCKSHVLLYGSGFLKNKTNYFTFIAKIMEKIKFKLISNPKKKPLNGPRFS